MRLNEECVRDFIAGKSVIVLGSAPNVIDVSAETLEKHDIIVRVNNYSLFNRSKRVDIYYSFFGHSIQNVDEKVARDKPKFLFFKYPFDFNFTRHSHGRAIDGRSGDFRFVQKIRENLIINYDYFAQTKSNFISNFCAVGAIPTTGVAAILDVIRYEPSALNIAGFDFFKSKKHNINEAWDGSGGHDLSTEEIVVADMITNRLIKNLSSEREYDQCENR